MPDPRLDADERNWIDGKEALEVLKACGWGDSSVSAEQFEKNIQKWTEENCTCNPKDVE